LPGDDILEKSLTEPDAPYQVLKIFKDSIHFGTSRPWAGVHQHGSPARNIPRREFMKFTSKDHSRWNDIIARHIIRPHRIK
jgi:phage gpG-like protein